jgi:hypothetical protein
MSDVTVRLALPMTQPGQAQKEMTHNEALARLDMAVQAVVVAAGLDRLPGTPQPGPMLAGGRRAGGDWVGRAAGCGLDRGRMALRCSDRGHGGVGPGKRVDAASGGRWLGSRRNLGRAAGDRRQQVVGAR